MGIHAGAHTARRRRRPQPRTRSRPTCARATRSSSSVRATSPSSCRPRPATRFRRFSPESAGAARFQPFATAWPLARATPPKPGELLALAAARLRDAESTRVDARGPRARAAKGLGSAPVYSVRMRRLSDRARLEGMLALRKALDGVRRRPNATEPVDEETFRAAYTDRRDDDQAAWWRRAELARDEKPMFQQADRRRRARLRAGQRSRAISSWRRRSIASPTRSNASVPSSTPTTRSAPSISTPSSSCCARW